MKTVWNHFRNSSYLEETTRYNFKKIFENSMCWPNPTKSLRISLRKSFTIDLKVKKMEKILKKKNKFANFGLFDTKIKLQFFQMIFLNPIGQIFDLTFCSSYRHSQSPPSVQENTQLPTSKILKEFLKKKSKFSIFLDTFKRLVMSKSKWKLFEITFGIHRTSKKQPDTISKRFSKIRCVDQIQQNL